MAALNDFDESLCGCCDDCGICCFGCVAPAFLFGENIEKIDGTNCVVAYCAYSLLCDTCTCCFYHFYKRGVLRHKYGLRKDQCNDCAVTFFCCQCAICQEARFLRKRMEQQQVMPKHTAIVSQPSSTF